MLSTAKKIKHLLASVRNYLSKYWLKVRWGGGLFRLMDCVCGIDPQPLQWPPNPRQVVGSVSMGQCRRYLSQEFLKPRLHSHYSESIQAVFSRLSNLAPVFASLQSLTFFFLLLRFKRGRLWWSR